MCCKKCKALAGFKPEKRIAALREMLPTGAFPILGWLCQTLLYWQKPDWHSCFTEMAVPEIVFVCKSVSVKRDERHKVSL